MITGLPRFLLLSGLSIAAVNGQGFLANGLTRFAGSDASTFTGDNGPALQAAFHGITGLFRDGSGEFILTEPAWIRKIDLNGTITTVAGTGVLGTSGDGGLATAAQLNYASAPVLDANGNLYFIQNQTTIREIDLSGVISTLAGVAIGGSSADGVDRLSALIQPTALAFGPGNLLYFTDQAPSLTGQSARVRVIGADGKVSTIVGGSRGTAGEGGPAKDAQLEGPTDLKWDAKGNLYIADARRVLLVNPQGILTRIAGNPAVTGTSDEVPAVQTGLNPVYVALSPTGDLFVTTASRIRRISPDGIIHAFAGTEGAASPFTEACGDAEHAVVFPLSPVVDPSGNVYFAEFQANRLEEVTLAGVISTTAGLGPNLYSGDGGPALEATFASPNGLWYSGSTLYVADTGNNRVRAIDASGTIRTVAGAGGPIYYQDPTCVADNNNYLRGPSAVAVDSGGNLLVADTGKHRVVKVDANGLVTPVAGTGSFGSSGDGGPALAADLGSPVGVAMDASGNVLIADSASGSVRRVDPAGIITTVSNSGASGSLALDAAGNVYVPALYEVDKIGRNGTVIPVVGTGEYDSSIAPGYQSPPEELRYAAGVAVDAEGSIYVSDRAKHNLQRISHSCAFSSDQAVSIPSPGGLAFDAQQNLLVADSYGVIWRVTPIAPPASEQPTPIFGRTGIRSAAPTPLIPVTGLGQPLLPPSAPPIAPGELLQIRGVCFGPLDPVFLSYDSDGTLPTTGAATQILFNGTAAPLIEVSAGMVVAQAPLELNGSSSANVTLTNSGVSATTTVAVAAANPAWFTTTGFTGGQAIAVNQDGTLNSLNNPATEGMLLVLYATGTGVTQPPGADGLAGVDAQRTVALPVQVTVGGVDADVLYAGDAPGFVGLTQINVLVPAGAAGGVSASTPAILGLKVGAFTAAPTDVTVAVTP